MDHLSKAKRVIQIEIDELENLLNRIDENFSHAVNVLKTTIDSGHKFVIIGVGKCHNIGHKIAATLNSTGAPTVVLNSQNALHGDLGIVSNGDTILALSYSGETNEILDLLPALRRFKINIISMTGNTGSSLGRNSDIILDTKVDREACPLNLAPTSSTTAMLVLGDALAMTLLESRGFVKEDFAKLHPGGSLGKTLLTKVSDIMRIGDKFCTLASETKLKSTLEEMIRARSGAAVIISSSGNLEGILTQGDFVRSIQKDPNILDMPVSKFMTKDPITIQGNKLAVEAIQIIGDNRIDDLVVLDETGIPIGLVDSQDLSRMKLV
ncbi:MAG TPA: KpsF/GutQ family sugar-phosphate isomerase [Verrucomicrobia bacterium]|nr:KpsF/GutQ family sugar-phosphate isomerase [Verrucomicrobiales bacterium]HIL55125.1 KpsF/GutQ family sugar-phosphate isomerase [Verrucomicrobiota bacterium]